MYALYQKLIAHEAALYNKSFNPNVCHVCKFKCQLDYKICEVCKTNLYCSEEHKLEDQPYHMQICQAISEVNIENPLFYCKCNNLEEWIESRKHFMNLVKNKLARELKLYEVQMIMFKQSCFICHTQCDLHACNNCFSINYCSDHKIEFDKYHKNQPDCMMLKLCLEIDIAQRYNPPPYKKLFYFCDEIKPLLNIDSFLGKYIHSITPIQRYFYIDYVSGPLTLYHGLQRTNLLNILDNLFSYVIHIVTANPVDIEYLQAWELFLHILDKTGNLKIIIIGLEYQDDYYDIETFNNKLCLSYPNKKTLNIEFHRKLYYNYVQSNSYTRPNVIIGYQADLTNWNTSMICTLQSQNCPLLLTTKSKDKASLNLIKIQEVLGSSLNPVYYGENKFNSNRPYKDFENNGVFYRNKFVTVFTNLYVSPYKT